MLFQRLRAETRGLHEDIENYLPVLKPEFTIEKYRRLLLAYAGFYAPVETALSDLSRKGLSVFTEDRRKCPLLMQDLEKLCVPLSQVTNCHAIPDLASVGQGFGCMYVLEGATLGGQIISRHLKEFLGITPDGGGAFFASYGAELGQRWTEFRESVAADARADAAADEILESARQTFLCFHAWLRQADL